MIPRGRLDISAGGLLWALAACFRTQRPEALAGSLQSRWPAWQVVPALSVRTAWDAWLAEQHWLPGDEVLVSAVTIPDMLRIIREHGLVPVPVPIDFDSLAIAPAELERRITPRSRAVLIAHLFGSRMPIGPLAEVACRHRILLVEDAAQAFSNSPPSDRPAADAVLLSFGPTKTCTALGGAVVLLRDAEMAVRLGNRLESYPQQPTREFLFRVLKMMAVQALGWPPAFTLLVWVLRTCGVDSDKTFSTLTRGFSGRDYWSRLRRRPAPPLLALLAHRLRSFPAQSLALRQARAERLWQQLADVQRPGAAATEHTHWVLPIAVANPDEFIERLRSSGYDATRLGSSLTQFADAACPEDSRWSDLVYLPHHPAVATAKLAAIVESSV